MYLQQNTPRATCREPPRGSREAVAQQAKLVGSSFPRRPRVYDDVVLSGRRTRGNSRAGRWAASALQTRISQHKRTVREYIEVDTEMRDATRRLSEIFKADGLRRTECADGATKSHHDLASVA